MSHAHTTSVDVSAGIKVPKEIYDPEERKKTVFAKLEAELKKIEEFAEELLNEKRPREDVTTLALRIIQDMINDLEKDVDEFEGPHFTKVYRTLQGHCTKLQTDLDALDFSGRDTLREEKKEAVLTISDLAKKLAKKTHDTGKSCDDGCEI
ncbi:unnamed protein product [Orchesella dallaii]|uniref:BAG domain-containing protein n=1 Tax=Orchesella dallaii TaxID=48710 RepID=A0ABP1Q7I9_9HEXA